MYRVVYVSSATKPFTSSELSNLAAKWQARNAADGITGLCLYIGGNFMQAFEGGDEAARTLFQRIKADSLHRDIVTILAEDTSDEPAFGDWSMDFREATDIPDRHLEGLRSFIDETLSGKTSQRSGLAVNLLAAFVMTMHPHEKTNRRLTR